MKKGLLFAASMAFCIGAMAQSGIGASSESAPDITSKHGEQFMPKAGDCALGFSATPFLNYIGNFFSQAGNNAPSANFPTNDMSIVAKYYTTDRMAWRARARVGLTNAKTYNAADDATNTFNTNVTLGAGPELRRGNTRVQGLLGAEGLVTMTSSKTTVDYAEDITAGDPPRLTENSTGLGFGVGARAFAGVELFVFPKTSIAFEYGYGLSFMSQGDSKTVVENGDGTTTETVSKGGSFIGLDTDNSGGTLTVIFHF